MSDSKLARRDFMRVTGGSVLGLDLAEATGRLAFGEP
jgi:hypothetical protein